LWIQLSSVSITYLRLTPVILIQNNNKKIKIFLKNFKKKVKKNKNNDDNDNNNNIWNHTVVWVALKVPCPKYRNLDR
jgi:hypothetical protein